MAIKFNPLTGNFDFTGSGGGGGASYIDGEVQNFSALPTANPPAVDSAYLVREPEGTWLINRKPAGIYIRVATTGTRATDWTYAGILPDVFNDANFLLYDNADSSKNLALQLSGISTGTTRPLRHQRRLRHLRRQRQRRGQQHREPHPSRIQRHRKSRRGHALPHHRSVSHGPPAKRLSRCHAALPQHVVV
jgi:hypothetical protein